MGTRTMMGLAMASSSFCFSPSVQQHLSMAPAKKRCERRTLLGAALLGGVEPRNRLLDGGLELLLLVADCIARSDATPRSRETEARTLVLEVTLDAVLEAVHGHQHHKQALDEDGNVLIRV